MLMNSRNNSKSSLEAAAEAAARVNAMLIAKGKLKLPQGSTRGKAGNRNSGDLFTAEVEINDAPLSARNLLTRGHTQDEINKISGAAVSTRGRYMSPEDKHIHRNNPRERPLYLHVQAAEKDAVDLAVTRIQEIINEHIQQARRGKGISKFAGGGRYNQGGSPRSGPSPFQQQVLQAKVWVGLEGASPAFDVKAHVIGEMCTNLNYVHTQTGANVSLRGRGSGFIEPHLASESVDPLHILLEHSDAQVIEAAKELAQNLIQTIQADYTQWEQEQRSLVQLVHPPPGPQQVTLQPGVPPPGVHQQVILNPPGIVGVRGPPPQQVQFVATGPPQITHVVTQPPQTIFQPAMIPQTQPQPGAPPGPQPGAPPPGFVPGPGQVQMSMAIGQGPQPVSVAQPGPIPGLPPGVTVTQPGMAGFPVHGSVAVSNPPIDRGPVPVSITAPHLTSIPPPGPPPAGIPPFTAGLPAPSPNPVPAPTQVAVFNQAQPQIAISSAEAPTAVSASSPVPPYAITTQVQVQPTQMPPPHQLQQNQPPPYYLQQGQSSQQGPVPAPQVQPAQQFQGQLIQQSPLTQEQLLQQSQIATQQVVQHQVQQQGQAELSPGQQPPTAQPPAGPQPVQQQQQQQPGQRQQNSAEPASPQQHQQQQQQPPPQSTPPPGPHLAPHEQQQGPQPAGHPFNNAGQPYPHLAAQTLNPSSQAQPQPQPQLWAATAAAPQAGAPAQVHLTQMYTQPQLYQTQPPQLYMQTQSQQAFPASQAQQQFATTSQVAGNVAAAQPYLTAANGVQLQGFAEGVVLQQHQQPHFLGVAQNQAASSQIVLNPVSQPGSHAFDLNPTQQPHLQQAPQQQPPPEQATTVLIGQGPQQQEQQQQQKPESPKITEALAEQNKPPEHRWGQNFNRDYNRPHSPENTQPTKRRFTEEKPEEPEPSKDVLGYEHGPPHLANLQTQGAAGSRFAGSNQPAPPGESENGGEKQSSRNGDLEDKLLMPPPPPPPTTGGETAVKPGWEMYRRRDGGWGRGHHQQQQPQHGGIMYRQQPQVYRGQQPDGYDMKRARMGKGDMNNSLRPMFYQGYSNFGPNEDRRGDWSPWGPPHRPMYGARP